MDQICTNERAISLLNAVNHERVRNGVPRHWKYDQNGRVTIQSICWLYCWGVTGHISQDTRVQIQNAFAEIFGIPLDEFSRMVDIEWARNARYCQNFDNLADIPAIFVSSVEISLLDSSSK